MTTEGVSPALQQLIKDDAVRQLRKPKGLMATLGSEDGALKLDWVEGVQRLLADNAMLEQVEAEARAVWERGIRHIIWAGMGGSIMAVRVLTDLGFCSGRDNGHVTIYPLDSTDPAALNEIVREIAQAKHLARPSGEEASTPAFLRALLDDVMMVGVAMGMTSEEPITHLEWFTELLQQSGLRPAEHLLVMTLPGSYLDRFAEVQQAPSLPLQLDRGTGTGGRMSAPTTRVFLLPAALFLTRLSGEPGQLRVVLRRAWEEYDLALATERPADHPFVQLAAALSDASLDGACRLLLSMPKGWQPLVPWIEQLMEESLGKGGKGVVVFDDQFLNPVGPRFIVGPAYRSSSTLQVRVVTDLTQLEEEKSFHLYQPYLARKEPLDRLVAVATSFLGWQLSMALYGYLHRITFAGQPAVENYKARARVLRTQDDPLQVTKNWAATTTETDPSSGIAYSLLAPQGVEAQGSPASIVAGMLQRTATASPGYPSLGYLDLTINGELPSRFVSALDAQLRTIGNELLGVPVKLRRAPAAYHSTEQSEMDGPPFLVSLRVLACDHEASIPGSYTDTFLCAQAVSTWQAMMEQGRPCFLLIIDGSIDDAIEPFHRFFSEVAAHLRGQ
jgi:glucose-6-phosphate isomerase